MPPRSTRATLVGLAVLLVLVVGGLLLTRGGAPDPAASPAVASPTAATPAAGRITAAPATAADPGRCVVGTTPVPGAVESRLAVRPLCALPVEAAVVYGQIRTGGPYRYDRDGIVFANAERLLPTHPRDYYHEFTVPTPGSSDRGARRLITGSERELYYTGDHYASFVVVDATAVGR